MNKYSSKILNFIKSEHSFEQYKIGYHPVIKKIKEQFSSQKIEQFKCTHSSIIKKMHTYEEVPLLYILFVELNKDNMLNNNNLKSIYDFYDWHRNNFSKINLKKILKGFIKINKYKEFYDLFFNTTKERETLHELLYENSFLSLDVLQHAESEDLIYETYEGNNSNITLYGYSSKSGIVCFQGLGGLTTQRFSEGGSQVSYNSSVNLVIFYGKQKKYVPKNKYYCSDNINSGMTESGRVVMIWRQEEFYKVLIHELVHYFNIDFYISDSIYQKIYQIFEKHFKIDGIDRINESYTEAFAILVHSILYATENSIDIDTVIQNELLFAHFQIAKILNHFDIESYNDLKNNKLYQNTSVCSYYIIKCLLMINYDLLLDYLDKNGFMVKNSESEYIDLYSKILEKNNIVDEAIVKMINTIKKCNNEHFACKTMRMSLYQI